MNGIGATHFDHVTVLITDVAKSRAFYGGVLGLTEIAPPAVFDFVAVWYDLGGQYLHLLRKPQADSLSPRHFCLHVASIEDARQSLRNAGIAIAETVRIPGCERFFISDPDGNRIEILQWQTKYDPDRDGRLATG